MRQKVFEQGLHPYTMCFRTSKMGRRLGTFLDGPLVRALVDKEECQCKAHIWNLIRLGILGIED